MTDPERGLVTVTGPGGVGKTRLALELAHRFGQRFKAGATFVSLAELSGENAQAPSLPASDAERPPGTRRTAHERQLMAAVARALGAVERPGVSLRTAMIDELRDKHLLLVLDDLEHLIEAAGAVSALLSACPGLKVPARHVPRGGCGIERVARGLAAYGSAVYTCQLVGTPQGPGRRLPTQGELMAAFSAVEPPGSGELTSNVYPSTSAPGEVDALYVTDKLGHVGTTPDTAAGSKAYRCVAEPLN